MARGYSRQEYSVSSEKKGWREVPRKMIIETGKRVKSKNESHVKDDVKSRREETSH